MTPALDMDADCSVCPSNKANLNRGLWTQITGITSTDYSCWERTKKHTHTSTSVPVVTLHDYPRCCYDETASKDKKKYVSNYLIGLLNPNILRTLGQSILVASESD